MIYNKQRWTYNQTYNLYVEFPRLIEYLDYFQEWFIYTDGKTLNEPTNYTISTSYIPTIKQFNNLKTTYNEYLQEIGNKNLFDISTKPNQAFTASVANQLEDKTATLIEYVGNKQFQYDVGGLAVAGSDNIIVGV